VLVHGLIVGSADGDYLEVDHNKVFAAIPLALEQYGQYVTYGRSLAGSATGTEVIDQRLHTGASAGGAGR
jgi:hypothetical protein